VIGCGRPGRAETKAETVGKELVYELHGHLVEEVFTEDGSMLRCVRCGASAPLTEASKLMEKHCQAQKQDNPQTLCGCGRPAKHLLPSYEPTTMIFKDLHLCDACSKDYLNILRNSGPAIGRMRGRIPANSYWFDLYNTVFQEINGVYPCPACDQFYDSLYEVVKHFGEKHPDKAFDKPREIIIDGFEVVATWQYIWCKRCLRFFENEQHFQRHLKLHEARQ
jgi:uncharacterized C2H2 Zn-finger protein